MVAFFTFDRMRALDVVVFYSDSVREEDETEDPRSEEDMQGLHLLREG